MTNLMQDVANLHETGVVGGVKVGPDAEESLKLWALVTPKAKGVEFAAGMATFSSRQRKYESQERVIKREIRASKAESAAELSQEYSDKNFEIPVSDDVSNYEKFIREFPHLFIDMI